jgi:hypothetical protein
MGGWPTFAVLAKVGRDAVSDHSVLTLLIYILGMATRHERRYCTRFSLLSYLTVAIIGSVGQFGLPLRRSGVQSKGAA